MKTLKEFNAMMAKQDARDKRETLRTFGDELFEVYGWTDSPAGSESITMTIFAKKLKGGKFLLTSASRAGGMREEVTQEWVKNPERNSYVLMCSHDGHPVIIDGEYFFYSSLYWEKSKIIISRGQIDELASWLQDEVEDICEPDTTSYPYDEFLDRDDLSRAWAEQIHRDLFGE